MLLVDIYVVGPTNIHFVNHIVCARCFYQFTTAKYFFLLNVYGYSDATIQYVHNNILLSLDILEKKIRKIKRKLQSIVWLCYYVCWRCCQPICYALRPWHFDQELVRISQSHCRNWRSALVYRSVHSVMVTVFYFAAVAVHPTLQKNLDLDLDGWIKCLLLQ